ncbi:type 1 glutamine amidotransferase [Agilicoccus flavus]|uniref:type 1 glutamine amidotransferase n=1 Tax=Agilicoccus flavus TaxID=2775968 RepID=UPI001CF65E2D|nr:type 1 glutamine amidotransferase [Agilicoccus flavus]
MPGAYLCVQPETNCGAGLIADRAKEVGVGLRFVRPFAGETVPTRLPDGVDGLIVLGGSMGAHDDAAHPWLTATKGLLAATVHDGAPVLGVCLGHQLLTVALGGAVRRSPDGRVCAVVEVSTAGTADAVFGSLPQRAPVLQWNEDVAVVLPPDAAVLATSSTGRPQIVRFARRAWGLQVHPEAVAEQARTWGGPADRPVVDALAAQVDEVAAAWAGPLDAFLALGGRP